MDIIFKRGTEVLETLTEKDMVVQETLDRLSETYDKQEIESYEIGFKAGVNVEAVHDIASISPDRVRVLIIKIK